VTNGQPLFTLECAADAAALGEAEARQAQARSRLDNLLKGRRPTEIASLEARLEQARAAGDLAQRDQQRSVQLLRDGAIAQSEHDRTLAQRDQAIKRVEELKSELATARLGGREDEVRAAEAEAAAAGAAVTRARWAVEQKQKSAPEAGLVEDTLFNPGEFVPAGVPVVSLLSPARLKVRFFVPESEASRLRVGQPLRVRIDGVAEAAQARLAYVSPQVEYTPPVIYSQENRAKLVFMCEATFETPDATRLHPGQPVEVHPEP
jgi:HlyD family secretion protein